MTIDTVFNISVVIFTVGNLAAMGLELNVSEAFKALRNARFEEDRGQTYTIHYRFKA